MYRYPLFSRGFRKKSNKFVSLLTLNELNSSRTCSFFVNLKSPQKKISYNIFKCKKNGSNFALAYTTITNGPDQVLPAESFKTTELDGCVKIYNMGPGPLSENPLSVYTMLNQTRENYPNHPALLVKRDGKWRKWTYSEYFAECSIVAKAFIKLGLDRFHGVCIMGYNAPEWVIAGFGCIFAGGLSAGVYTTNSPDACRIIADNCRAQIIVVEDEYCLEKFLAVRKFLPHLKVIVQWAGKPAAPGVLSWEELLAIGKQESDDALNERLSLAAINQCCSVIYTSGTTGPPKGVMISQDNMTWGANFYKDYFKVESGTPKVVSYLPLSHVAAQMVDIYCAVRFAAAIYFSQPDALKGSLIDTLVEVQPSFFLGVPRIWEKIYEKLQEVSSQSGFLKRNVANVCKVQALNYYDAIRSGRELTSLEKLRYDTSKYFILDKVKHALGLGNILDCIAVSAPIDPNILEYFTSLDNPIMEFYGLSESITICSGSTVGHKGFKYGSVGKVFPQNEVKLVNEGQQRPGEGEICIRGRNVFMGYLRMPENTNEALDDEGWMHTGDLGSIDSEGFLYITGRLKELIITSGGENIPPNLIEDCVKRELPCISNAMLIGDKRKYLTMLLTLKAEVDLDSMMPLQELAPPCVRWIKGNAGLDLSTVQEAVEEIQRQPKGRLATAIQKGIDRYNTNDSISNAQRIQRWTILPHDFSLPTLELNNTLKIKRNYVIDKYEKAINDMYDGVSAFESTSKL